MTQGTDEAGSAIAELIEAYEQELLLYTYIKARYEGVRFDGPALNRPAPASMQADVAAVRESYMRVVSAVKRLFTLAMEAGLPSEGVPEDAGTTDLTEAQWHLLGMRLGRDVASLAGRGETLDLRSLRSSKWT